MDKRPATAVLRFAANDENVYGTVTQMTARDIQIRMHAMPMSNEHCAAGTEASLVVLAQNKIFTASTEVVSSNSADVTLRFTSARSMLRQRRQTRMAIDLDISYRHIQDNGCYGSWRSGVTRDVSANGMCLLIEAGFEIPRKVELLINLPGQTADSHPSSAHSEILSMAAPARPAAARAPGSERPVKAIARVAGHRLIESGQIALGLAYNTVSLSDEARLTRFLEAPWHPIA